MRWREIFRENESNKLEISDIMDKVLVPVFIPVWYWLLIFAYLTRKTILDQDNADLRAVKEMFLPDGDLYTDGKGRTRHFRWQGIDENSQVGLFGNKELWGEEDGMAIELSTEEEIQRRKERYEREAFLREEMVLNGSFVSQCLVFTLHQIDIVLAQIKQPRRQRQGKRNFKNDLQIFQTSSR